MCLVAYSNPTAVIRGVCGLLVIGIRPNKVWQAPARPSVVKPKPSTKRCPYNHTQSQRLSGAARCTLMKDMKPFQRHLSALIATPFLMGATPSVQTAQQAIKAQQGCYQVTFQYEEIEAHQADYTLAPPKTSQVVELITVDKDQSDHIVLQHILVTPPRIKHWKQIWRFEHGVFDQHSGPDSWNQTHLDSDEKMGTWTQEVRGVADNPRYGCAAAWSLENETVWTCQTWAPKPRRDKDREDYNVLDRTNTHRIHDKGWIHEQRNTKTQVTTNGVTPIVTEVGNNTYERIDDSECEKAALWWSKRKTTWDAIQHSWDDVSGQYERYTVTPQKGFFPLWIRLFWLARKPLPERKHQKLQRKASRTIEAHIVPSTDAHRPNTKASDK